MQHRIFAELMWPDDGLSVMYGGIPDHLKGADKVRYARRAHSLRQLHRLLLPEEPNGDS
jgi:hypothetical protein